MWFTAVKTSNKEQTHSRLLQRVMNITDVVAACRDSGFEWLEQLLDNVSHCLFHHLLGLCEVLCVFPSISHQLLNRFRHLYEMKVSALDLGY